MLGNCIGSQNYKYFMTVLYNAFWCSLAIVLTNFDYLLTKDRAIFWHRKDFLAMIVLSTLCLHAVTLLGAMHVYFLLNHTCTIEVE